MHDLLLRRLIETTEVEAANKIERALAPYGVRVTYSKDLQRFPSPQVSGPWTPYPDPITTIVAPEGFFTFMDGGELNLGTELSYSNYKDQRQVSLKKGEAFFKVSHDSSHPFVVKAASGEVRVTGTQFNVWMYEDQVRVTLLEGSVLVNSDNHHPDGGFRLDPGMQASYRQGDYQPQISQTYTGDSSLAWRHGKLVLDNLALGEALPLINRYLSTPVMLADSATGNIRVGGIYDTTAIKSLVTTLPKVLPVYLTRNQDGNPVINSLPGTTPKS